MYNKTLETISIQDAMDNLATISGIHLDAPGPLGIIKKTRFVTSEEEMEGGAAQWLSGEGSDAVVNLMDATFRAVHNYLDELYDNPEMDWNGKRTRKGIAAMMALVGEAARKMDRYLAYRLEKPLAQKIEEREDYKVLQRFYVDRFSKKFEGGIEGDAAWQEEWKGNQESATLDAAGSGLKDFETVRSDREYELFYIRTEEGKPYFNYELLRNIKLTADFDADSASFEEDPLLKVRSMMDRDLNGSAIQIIRECEVSIHDFYKGVKKLADNGLAKQLNMALIALYLAANPRNLLQNITGKSCLQYFEDFIGFLRASLSTVEYQKFIAYPPEKGDTLSQTLLYLTHHLARALFTRAGGVKQEAIGMIFRTMRKGETQAKKGAGDTLWGQFLFDDDKFRTLLAKFPNGPLFKILDLIREEQEGEKIVPFDPIIQENLPSALYAIQNKEKQIAVLRIPSPTRQTFINKTEVIDEFRAFLRSGASAKQKKHLLINLQDRTSWREYARAHALETLQKNAEFHSFLFVMTLPKDTDFYNQSDEYSTMDRAEEFLSAFKGQLEDPEACGFFFPSQWKKEEILSFAKGLFPLIHTLFFDARKSLKRREREDFIEIFYQFLALKAIDQLSPDSISFTCKDAIDAGAAAAACFYGFTKLLNEDLSLKEDQDFFRWLLYIPALFIRERAIDAERLNRTLSALERIDEGLSKYGDKILKGAGEFYKAQVLKNIFARHT